MRRDEPMAVLFSYDPETGESTADPLVGLHSSGMDPITWAFALKDSIEGDFPGRLWSITGNDAAKELRKAALIDAVLGPSDLRPSRDGSSSHTERRQPEAAPKS